MGELYDTCQRIAAEIDKQGLDPFRTRGAIAIKVGFLVSSVKPDEPDDQAKIAALKAAAEELLGVSLDS